MLQVTSIEQYKESRRFSIGNDNISQTMRFILYGNFTDEAPTDDFWIINDDHLVMQKVYEIFPWFREFPTASGGVMTLFLTGGEIVQSGPDNWIVDLTYDIPNDSFSGTNQDAVNNVLNELGLGPDAGENNGAGWSQEYTQLSFNSTAETRHISTSLKATEIDVATRLPIDMTAPANILNNPTAIGDNGEEIEGTDVYDRDFKFQITKYFTPQQLKYAYIRRIYRITATANEGTFFGFPKGTTLFLGASGSGHLMQNVPITFEFAVRNNFKFTTVAPSELNNPDTDVVEEMYDTLQDAAFANTTEDTGIPGGAGVHSGWSVVDYRYIATPDSAAKQIFQLPAYRIIHQVYPYSDFSKLQI